MLLTLNASSLANRFAAAPRGDQRSLFDLPAFARDDLGLRGLNLVTTMLAGMSRAELDRLRERADKAACACLLLIEPEALALADARESAGSAAQDRLSRVLQAGNLLGCNSIAVRVAGTDTPEHLAAAAGRLRKAMAQAERLEMNILVSPSPGLTESPDRVTELLKKVGGFRVGTFPDFQAAAATADPVAYLRRLTPYAPCVSASTVRFGPGEPAPTARKTRRTPAAGAATGKPAGSKPAGTKASAAKADATTGDAATPAADGAVASAPARGRKRASVEPAALPPAEPDTIDHTEYAIAPLVEAVLSVGFDGTLSIDYRGGGDVRTGLVRTRRLLESLLAVDDGDDAPADDVAPPDAGPDPEVEE